MDDVELLEAWSAAEHLPEGERKEVLTLIQAINDKRGLEKARSRFMPFVEKMWPNFIGGRHHKIMADAFERVASGDLKRLIINLPPRHSKSIFASYLLPAWFLGRFPDKKIIQASNTAELAVGFGRQVRNLVNSEEYKEVFPGVGLRVDSKAAGRWNTNADGEYFAVGVGGTMTGKGADILIIDDPHDEQQAAQAEFNPEIYDKVYEWYTSGPRQRLQPGAAIIVVMTRWSLRDLTGQIIKKSVETEKGEHWEVIELPALMPSGEPLWPEFWSKQELEALEEELPKPKWQAQYQQRPTSDEGALIKREWWRRWTKPNAPSCEAIIQSWDTAFLKTQRSDYSAMTTWGVFYHPNDQGVTVPQLILLDSLKAKMEFPELKMQAYRSFQEWEPDQIVVEKKASGAPLIFELRAMGIPVTEFDPTRGTGDKIARVNAVTDLFASGMVWAPERKWAEDVIEECAAFPAGENDDLVDATVYALMRFRQGGWIRTNLDEDEVQYGSRRVREYY